MNKLTKLEKLPDQRGRECCLKMYLQPHMTLTFDLLTPKVDRFMPLTCEPLVPLCSRMGLFVLSQCYVT